MKAVRLAIWAMVLVGLFGVGRVLFSAGSDREEWMRWVPTVDLVTLERGRRVELTMNGRNWLVYALTTDEVEAVYAVDERKLPDPVSLNDRLLRVEIDGRTRYYATIAAAASNGCRVSLSDEGWGSPCGRCYRFDFVGRSLSADCANLERPSFVISDRKLYLHPDQPTSAGASAMRGPLRCHPGLDPGPRVGSRGDAGRLTGPIGVRCHVALPSHAELAALGPGSSPG